jgi:predicted murein hydrolase (TIGR00659 family)
MRALAEALGHTAFWSLATILIYFASKRLHRRYPNALLSPLVLTPLVLIGLALGLHTNYGQYFGATSWLVAMLGPATVAFAIPIYEQRALLARYWPVLAAGVLVGSTASILSAWGLASLLSLDGALRTSLLPRSISTPFAMTMSADIGGTPELTALFVVITGVLGATLGGAILNVLPLRSALARGALLGMGAHGAGVARARQVGDEEGSVAGVVMVLVGVANVLLAPLLGHLLR